MGEVEETIKESPYSILVCDDDMGQLELARDLLESEGHRVLAMSDATKVFDRAVEDQPDVIMLDVKMPRMSGYQVCELIKGDERTSAIPVIFVTASYKDLRSKVYGFELGADDYITKPYEIDELVARLNAILRMLEMRRKIVADELEKARLKAEISELNLRLAEQGELSELVAGAPSMGEALKLIRMAGDTDAHVLIMGETGTGKGVVASTIQRMSPRASGPFVKVDCSVLTGSLLESELFGHEKGSFTGAVKTREGRFERAHGGTIFLDEIGELPVELQAKLLRVVQDCEFERVGGDRTFKVDVRILAATNIDLEKAVNAGRFRRDLYYRLNVLPIRLPPLRQRSEDLAPLAGKFLERFAGRSGKPGLTLEKDALEKLMAHHWPGNIRELEHVIERAVILTSSDVVTREAILLDSGSEPPPAAAPQVSPELSLAELERLHIERVLSHTGGNKKQAAEILGISRNTLYEKLKSFGAEAD